jgi:hypothetical protein
MRHSPGRHVQPRPGLPRLSRKHAAAAAATVVVVQAAASSDAWANRGGGHATVTVSSLTLSPTTITAGTPVSATAVLSSNRTIQADALTIAVRSAQGADYDFGGARAATITSAPLTFTAAARTFPAGSYTYYVSYEVGDVWRSLSPAKSFTVGAAGSTPGSTPSSTPSSSPSSTPTSSPSSTPSSTPTTTAPGSGPSPTATSAPTSSPSSSPSSTPSTTPTGTPSPTSTSGPTTSPSGTPSSSPSTTVPTPPPTTPTTTPSGTYLPPTWSDDFTGENVPLGTWTGCSSNGPVQSSHCTGLPANVDSKWWAYPSGWQDTSKLGTYNPAKTLSIANGQMTIHLNRDSTGTWVAAPLPKLPNAVGKDGGQQYGTYSVTWKADQPTAGFKLAWLLWPDSGTWPGDGEIDFPEGSLGGSISAFMHRQGGTSGSSQDAYSTGVPMAGAWHTTVVDWQADHCDFYVDGKLVGHSTSAIPNTPMHLVLQSETSGSGPALGAFADIHISNYSYWKPGTWSPSLLSAP